MTKSIFISVKAFAVFVLCTAFVSTDDTIKDKDKQSVAVISAANPAPSNKEVKIDSLVSLALNDVAKYNRSVEAKDLSNKQVLEINKRMLKYEKEENKLIKELVLKEKTTKKIKNNKELIIKVDSVCNKYKTPLFGKKKCIEYTKVYTIIKDGKEINLKEIK